MGDKSQKGKDKDKRQKAAKEVKDQQKKHDKQEEVAPEVAKAK